MAALKSRVLVTCAGIRSTVRSILATTAKVIATAAFWYVAFALAGIGAVSRGVAIQFGTGYGLIAFGVLCLAGSEVLRAGMRRG